MTTTPATSALDAAAADFRAALLRRDEAALRRLMAAYGPVYQRIQARVATLTAQIAEARAAGATVRPSWLAERGRLESLQRQVVAEWAAYAETASAVITETQRQAVAAATQEAHALTVAALDDAGAFNVGADVARLRPDAVAELVGVLGDGSPLRELLEQLGQQAARDVAAALTHAVAVGRSPRQTARDIRAALGGDLNRALTVARTEHLRAYRGASLQSYQANADLLRGWQWRASPSRRTCCVCLAMDGREFSLEEPMPAHVNCFPAGTMVLAPPVVASTARWYEGEIVEIETVSGNLLTVTPNHPILTPEGWVAAGLLHEGSDVISARDAQAILRTVNPDDDHIPAAIEQVAESLRRTSGVVSVTVPAAPEHFHGDGEGSEVDIVYADRLLGDGLNPASLKPFLEEQFAGRDMGLSRLSRLGALSLLFDRLFTSTRRSVRSLSVALMIFRRSCLRQQPISLKGRSDGHARQLQPTADNIARDTKGFSQLFLGLTSPVAHGNLDFGQIGLCSRCGTALRGGDGIPGLLITPDATHDQEPAQSLPGDAVLAGQILTAFASQIVTDRVLKLSIRRFAGHVYNLETKEGWYIANNIITHNCRCTMIPLLRDRPTPERETGEAWFARQDAATQRELLGPGKYDLYRQGRITLGDLVGTRDDPRWGRSVYQRSLRELRGGGRAASVPIPQSLGAAVDPRAQLRAQRQGQLAAMSDAELRAEVAAAQRAQWKPTRLIEHAKEHRRHFERLLGGALTPSQLEELSQMVVHSWDRLFTEIDAEGAVSYLFLTRWKQSDATMIVAVSRDGTMRTCYPTDDMVQWLERHISVVEITNRVKP